ncbi:hypothetical protein [Clostridium isatidis]|nr:hypothetical protein [Clostridium isatidis]
MKGRWESLEYFYMIKIREGVHQNNIYNYKGCIENMNKLEALIDDTMGLFSLADDFSNLFNEITSDVKGKVLGTRLQARNFLIRTEREQIKLARKDSDDAIEQFQLERDKARQYQYRCQIECEAGEYINALNWLYKSVGLNFNNQEDFYELTEKIKKLDKASAIFTTMHYLRILSEASFNGEISLADNLYSAWVKSKLESLEIIKCHSFENPYEVIFAKLAGYLLSKGNVKSALEKYKIAVSICKNNAKFLTARSIGLVIQAELTALLCKFADKYNKEYKEKEAYKNLIKDYNDFMNSSLPETIINTFSPWKETLDKLQDVADNNKKYEMLWKISRAIFY